MSSSVNKKKVIYTEAAYFLGLILLAIGVSFMEASDYGISMVVAPAYLLYRKISLIFPFFSFGMAEYSFQAALLFATMLIVRRFRISWFLSFGTAVLYGFILDGCMSLVALLPFSSVVSRIILFIIGVVLCSIGVSFLFHTYLPPEAYELFVKLVSNHFHININVFKTGYDIISMLVAVLLSFCFFGLWNFVGVKIGTLICALCNGFLISRVSCFLESHYTFQDALPWRSFFD